MIEYGTEPINPKLTMPNPEYKTLTYKLKKENEKKARLEARKFKQLEDVNTIDLEDFATKVF